MNWVDTTNFCLRAEDHAVCFNCLSVINVGKSGSVEFGAGFARPFLGCIFPNFGRVIWFYEIKLEVEVDFCMFLVVYMFSKQISCWNRIGRQLLGGFELADELADSFSPVLHSSSYAWIVSWFVGAVKSISQNRRKTIRTQKCRKLCLV